MGLRPPGIYTCHFCGAPTDRRIDYARRIRCIDCSIERSAQRSRNLHEHQGTDWMSWLNGMARMVARERAKLVVDPGTAAEPARDSGTGTDTRRRLGGTSHKQVA